MGRKKLHKPAPKGIKPIKAILPRPKRRLNLEAALLKAGFSPKPDLVWLMLLRFGAGIIAVLSMVLLFVSLFKWGVPVWYAFVLLSVLWLLGLPTLLLLLWLGIVVYLDFRAYSRAKKIEEVLADFFQLAAANIRAGMTIDKAMFYAVRPKFGVLAKEIEKVAKESMTGTPLERALQDFASRYDSMTLKRSVSLLIEGMNSGGEIGELLQKISLNISESQILKRDMAANVSTYAIFIVFGSIGAAPVLFALSGQLLEVITSIFSKIELPKEAISSFPISFSGVGLSLGHYRIFAIVMLSITAVFSAIITATIRRGSPKYGIKLMPFFIAASLGIFLISSWIIGRVFGGIF